MSELSIESAKDANEEAQQDYLRENDAGIPEDHRVDYENSTIADVSGHAESLITFDYIARMQIQDYGTLDDNESVLGLEQNLQGAGQYGFDVELTLANPEVVDGEVWVDDPDAQFPQFKVTGNPDSDNNDYEKRESVLREDGEIVGSETEGINFGASNWDGEPAEDFDPDYVTVSVTSRRAGDILGALDTAGQWFTDQDGNVVEGILETPPNFGSENYNADEDGYPRLVGYPELRADMVGQEGAIAWTFGQEFNGNRAVDVSVYKVEDGGLEKLLPLTPEDDAYNLPTYPRSGNVYWDDAGYSETDSQPETDEGVDAAREMMSDDEPSFGDLTEDGQSFVEDAVGAVSGQDLTSITELDGPDTGTSFDSFEERVTAQKAEDDIRTDADTLATIIDNEITGGDE